MRRRAIGELSERVWSSVAKRRDFIRISAQQAHCQANRSPANMLQSLLSLTWHHINALFAHFSYRCVSQIDACALLKLNATMPRGPLADENRKLSKDARSVFGSNVYFDHVLHRGS